MDNETAGEIRQRLNRIEHKVNGLASALNLAIAVFFAYEIAKIGERFVGDIFSGMAAAIGFWIVLIYLNNRTFSDK